MPGPYAEDQLPAECGCYHPDVTLRRDDMENDKRILFCIFHGEYSVPLGDVLYPKLEEGPLPTEEWREKERKRIRDNHQGYEEIKRNASKVPLWKLATKVLRTLAQGEVSSTGIKPMAGSLEKVYPNVALWVKAYGWIEIGLDYNSSSFARALDEGGMVWEGSDNYETLDEAMQALEAGLTEWITQNM